MALGIALIVGVGLIHGGTARAEIAVDVASGAPDSIFANGGTTHGWQFTVNVTMEVTHLGLYDRFRNGFGQDHPTGLWDDEGGLLAEDMLSAGVGDLLIDNFRYVDITDPESGAGGVSLTPGTEYTLGFFTETFAQVDGMVIFDGFHEINAAINYAGFGVSGFTNGLEMPTTGDPNGLHRWGPNFQFNVIPGPAAIAFLGLGVLRRRRRRDG